MLYLTDKQNRFLHLLRLLLTFYLVNEIFSFLCLIRFLHSSVSYSPRAPEHLDTLVLDEHLLPRVKLVKSCATLR